MALKNNNKNDDGIKVTWLFAHPDIQQRRKRSIISKKKSKKELTHFNFTKEYQVKRQITEYPDCWMKLRDITKDDFEEYGIEIDKDNCWTCQGHELHRMSDWSCYEWRSGILPSTWWFHMGLNDHVNSLAMESDHGLAKLFFIYEGHNIKTVDDNGTTIQE